MSRDKTTTAKSRGTTSKGKRESKKAVRKPEPPRIGSAAADWSRWPVGTTFRVLSTGQTYRVDDYGWALAGRNTIDLYMASRRDMNNWGVRHEPIQVLHWGDPQQSLALLQARQSHKHCRRMALELQGLHEEAAALQ
jgi:3D (Asp-Asp-Asp) domain-containing protein